MTLRILITRAPAATRAFAEEVMRAGLKPVEAPLLHILTRTPSQADRELLTEAGTWVFTSTNAVSFVQNVERRSQQLCAVGDATARLVKQQLGQAPLVPTTKTSAGLAELIEQQGLVAPIVVLRAAHGRTELEDRLRPHGWDIAVVTTHQNRPILPPPALTMSYDWVTFFSPSAVKAYSECEPRNRDAKIACIGPTTASACTSMGWEVAAIASEPTSTGLIEAIAQASRGGW